MKGKKEVRKGIKDIEREKAGRKRERKTEGQRMHQEQEALETTTHLSLGVGLQPEQTAHLQGFSLDDSSPHEVLRVGVHIVQESRAKPQELRGKGGVPNLC